MLSINKQANKNGEKIPVFLVTDTLMQLIKVILSCVQMDATTMLGVVGCVLVVVCKRMQQLPTILGPAVHSGKDTSQK